MTTTNDLLSLKHRRGEIVDAMEELASKPGKWTNKRQAEFDALDEELSKLEKDIAAAEAEEAAAKARLVPAGRPVAGGRGSETFRTRDGRTVRAAAAGEPLFPAGPDDDDEPSLGECIRSMVTGAPLPQMQRAMAVGNGTAGGFMAPSRVAGEIVDLARNRSTAMMAGVRTVDMTGTGRLDFARVKSDPTPEWKAENQEISLSEPSFEQVSLVPKTLMVATPISLELIESAANVEAVVRDILSQSMAVALDRAIYAGSGTQNEPRGLLNDDILERPVNANLATDSSKAGYGEFVAALGTLRRNNVDEAAVNLVIPSQVSAQLDALRDSTEQPMRPPVPVARMYDGGRVHVSNNIPVASGSPDTTTAVMGDFRDVVVGVQRGLILQASMEAAGGGQSAWLAGQVWLRAMMMCDVAVLRPNQIIALTGLEV